MKISGDVVLKDEEFGQMQMHSVMNLLTIINGDLQVFEAVVEEDPILMSAIRATFDLAKALRAGEHLKFTPDALLRLKSQIQATLNHIHDTHPELFETDEEKAVLANFDSIFSIFGTRVEEIRLRMLYPDRWETYPIKTFEQDFKDFFTAVEKNSKGRYRIIYNIAEQGESDYLVNLVVENKLSNKIRIPILLKDSIRDLLGNARKYTPPGGSIHAGLIQDDKHLRFVVNDTGLGIPNDELELVVKFGYRATNVRHMRTMGGGYGLTKAHWVASHFGGELRITSEMGRGTRVELDVPLPI